MYAAINTRSRGCNTVRCGAASCVRGIGGLAMGYLALIDRTLSDSVAAALSAILDVVVLDETLRQIPPLPPYSHTTASALVIYHHLRPSHMPPLPP